MQYLRASGLRACFNLATSHCASELKLLTSAIIRTSFTTDELDRLLLAVVVVLERAVGVGAGTFLG
jgi:hypothetical protein